MTIPAGLLTVVLPGSRTAAARLARRLAGVEPGAARWGDVPLADLDRDRLRSSLLLLDADHLFHGTLAATLRVPAPAVEGALARAYAGDVWTSLGGTPDAEVLDGGGNLSGGQRQRLRLARALAAAPEVLIAIEPTSAVDADTESSIAAGVRDLRRGRTTVVVTSSPLWLHRADHVVRAG